MNLLAAAVEATNSTNVWDFGMQFAAVVGTFATGYLAYKANGSARSAKRQTEELRASTTTNGTTGGKSGVSLNQIQAKLSTIIESVERMEGEQVKVGRILDKLHRRVTTLEPAPVDLSALEAELDS
jgi:hypothetical protein